MNATKQSVGQLLGSGSPSSGRSGEGGVISKIMMKIMIQQGMVALEPSAQDKLMGALAMVPKYSVRLLSYLSAKQELGEMKNELVRLQACVRDLENMLQAQGPLACGRSSFNHQFVNWTVSFAESYYGLAVAFGAKENMLPRVIGYLRGQVQKSALNKAIDQYQTVTMPDERMSNVFRDLIQSTMKNVPGFLKP